LYKCATPPQFHIAAVLVGATKNNILKTAPSTLTDCCLFITTATVAAILYFFPVFLPLFTPGKWKVADNANFSWQMLFFVRHYSK